MEYLNSFNATFTPSHCIYIKTKLFMHKYWSVSVIHKHKFFADISLNGMQSTLQTLAHPANKYFNLPVQSLVINYANKFNIYIISIRRILEFIQSLNHEKTRQNLRIFLPLVSFRICFEAPFISSKVNCISLIMHNFH